ncbi:MAG TPA: hypothetical protein VM580_02785, partial [Labilithrix sp.]|nr:hypothetical protein [Labilithrix sp.]
VFIAASALLVVALAFTGAPDAATTGSHVSEPAAPAADDRHGPRDSAKTASSRPIRYDSVIPIASPSSPSDLHNDRNSAE